MKIRISLRQYVCLLGLFVLLAGTSVQAAEVSAVTRVTQTTFEVGQTFELNIAVALQGVLSCGGYFYLEHDPVLECVHVTTGGMFGAAQNQACAYARPGLLRIESTVAKFSEATTSAVEQTFATVTFRANASAAAAIRLNSSSQLFGAGLGNILTRLDDQATQQLTIFEPLRVTLRLPAAGQTITDLFTIEWLVQNVMSLPLELTLELSRNQGASWETFLSQTIAPAGTYQWDATGLANGSAYLLRASVKDVNRMVATVSDPFDLRHIPTELPKPELPQVPEPSTMLLMMLGLGGLLVWRRKRIRK